MKICQLIEDEAFLPGTIIIRSVPVTTLVPVRIEITQVLQQLEYCKKYVLEGKYLGMVKDHGSSTT